MLFNLIIKKESGKIETGKKTEIRNIKMEFRKKI